MQTPGVRDTYRASRKGSTKQKLERVTHLQQLYKSLGL